MDREKRRRRSYNTSDADEKEREGNHVQSGLPQTWTMLGLCPQGETAGEGKWASEEPGTTLIVARKPVQEKSCTGLGLHLPVPPNCGTSE